MASGYYKKRLKRTIRIKETKRGERIRPKSFMTEEKAKAYQAENKLKGTIEQKGKKFVLVA